MDDLAIEGGSESSFKSEEREGGSLKTRPCVRTNERYELRTSDALRNGKKTSRRNDAMTHLSVTETTRKTRSLMLLL